MVITEALAEIKTISARLAKKRESIGRYLVRPEALRDPLEKDGGSAAFVQSEMQSIHDLSDRIVAIRRAIAQANSSTYVVIREQSRTIAEWLTWRKETAPFLRTLYKDMLSAIADARRASQAARRSSWGEGGREIDKIVANDVVVNVNEAELSALVETLEATLGELDGQLSLKNAVTPVLL